MDISLVARNNGCHKLNFSEKYFWSLYCGYMVVVLKVSVMAGGDCKYLKYVWARNVISVV